MCAVPGANQQRNVIAPISRQQRSQRAPPGKRGYFAHTQAGALPLQRFGQAKTLVKVPGLGVADDGNTSRSAYPGQWRMSSTLCIWAYSNAGGR
jgi:hypothetical protein